MSRTSAYDAYKREKKEETSAATTKLTKKSLTDNVPASIDRLKSMPWLRQI